MKDTKKVSRRAFLRRSTKWTAVAVAAPYFVPSSAFGANDRVGIAYIGLGRRARQLMKLPRKTEVVACSDIYEKRMKAFCASRFGRKAKAYADYRELLEDKNVDGIITASPDHWHALVSIHACQAGKDVYVEKPMTVTVEEGRVMVTAARKYNRIVQVGSQQRSTVENQVACELIRQGVLGKIKVIHGANFPSPWECELPAEEVPEGLDWERWLGPTPPRPYHTDLYLPRAEERRDDKGRRLGWISFRTWSGGEMTGWGAHGLDQMQCALGMDETGPVEVWPELEGWKGPEKWPEGASLTCPVSFRYADGTLVKLDGKGAGGGGIFVGEKGTINLGRGKFSLEPLDLVEEKVRKKKTFGDPTAIHIANWVKCMRTRELSVADVAIGHRSTTMCHLGNIARWTGRRLKWDPEREIFPDDKEANALLSRPMREPWTLPKLS